MHLEFTKHLFKMQHGGFIHHAASLSRLRNVVIAVSVMSTCVACQVSASDPASNIEFQESALRNITSAVPDIAASSSQTSKSPIPSEKPDISKKVSKTVAVEPLSGTFRMAMIFDKGVKVKPRNEAEGVESTQPDGSQVSLLEIVSRNGKVEKCIHSSLKALKASEQPVCTSDGDAIRIVFSDGKAAFGATMEAVVRPDGAGAYKGPLLIRAIIIPDGKRIGELSLNRP